MRPNFCPDMTGHAALGRGSGQGIRTDVTGHTAPQMPKTELTCIFMPYVRIHVCVYICLCPGTLQMPKTELTWIFMMRSQSCTLC